MNTFKKKVLLLGMLTNLTTLSLTGCADKTIYCPAVATIKYKDEDIKGNISYEDIYGTIKVLILEYNGIVKPHLIVKTNELGNHKKFARYYDLKSGTLLMTKYENGTVTNGEYFTILEEHEFMEYFVETDDLKPKYDVTELIDYYDTNVEAELIEYIETEYSDYAKTLKDKSK